MLTYLIRTSRQPELTIAELDALLEDVQFGQSEAGWLEINTTEKLDQNWLNNCGSIQEILQIITSANLNNLTEAISENIDQSSFAINYQPENLLKNRDKQKLLGEVKKAIKGKVTGKRRYLNKNGRNVHSAYLLDQGWLSNKISKIVLVKWQNSVQLCKTVGIQDINAYQKRDYDKPARNMQRGMLPPKLAQIMLSLATNGEPQHIYDPFCGSGTILMEATLQGHQITGSDIDPKAIEESEKNLAWINPNQKSNLFTADATNLNKENIDWQKIDSIVTEGFLGTPYSKPVDLNQPKIQTEQQEITSLYKKFLDQISQNLKLKSNICLSVPVWRTTEGSIHTLIKVAEKIEQLGLQKKIDEPLIYIRPNQTVGRQIFSLQKI